MMYDYLRKHPFQCFLLMVLSGAGLGITTIDLYQIIASNIAFIKVDIGFAVRTGVLWQLLILLIQMALAMLCYFILRFCEHVLFDYFTASSLIKK